MHSHIRLFCCLLLASLCQHSLAWSSSPPNFVFIMADDLGWADVAFHGGNAPTPRLDQLANDSLELTQHYVAPVCSPTRAGLLTGRCWSRFGITTPTNSLALPMDTVTMPRALKTQGYDTCLAGKWHLGSLPKWGPNEFGFDHSYGSLAGGVSPWNHRYKKGSFTFAWHRNQQLIEESGHVTDLLTDEAVNWLQSRGAEPFFLYLPYTAIHLPLKEPKQWLDRVPESISGEVARHYAASVMHLDHSVGRILDALNQKGLRENTLVVFTSDNGGSTVENNDLKYPDDNCPNGRLTGNNQPLRGQKGDVYEGGTRVPTIVSWPNKIAKGKNGTPVQIIDWMPTFCSLSGFKPESDLKWDGTDLSGLLLNGTKIPDRAIYTAGPRLRASSLRLGDHKLVTHGEGESRTSELFNIAKDPGETQDLAKQQPERFQTLLAKLKEYAAADRDSVAQAKPIDDSLITAITKQTLWSNRDGKSRTWFHPRVCMMPDSDGRPIAMMNLQEIGGSDYFGPVHWSASSDLGRTWSKPQQIPSLGRKPVSGRDDGLMAGVCDVTPQYHPQTDTVLALGHVVFYKGDYFARKEQLARYPVYATRAKDGTWSERKILKWDDPRGAHIYSNNCGQRVVLPSGDVQMSFTFGPKAEDRMVAGVRSSFDGSELKVTEAGPALHNPVGRGLLEPSVTKFGDDFWMTIRAEDDHGYVSVSSDGLNWEEKKPWSWEDGTPLSMSTTQQHWLTHSDGLFLVYTRKDPTNENVMRWRSPLWLAQVDVRRRCLIKSTERVVLPLVGDGVNDPNKVALMGNFDVTNVSPHESWVTVGEWMPRDGYRGDVLLARIHWSKPNRLPLW
ncbi:sulfatase-like hydrolase/transferase [Stieleria varia]|uniref:Arylsulfatase n=1 Tax=Stieleria varia TaxID=2528005 RepID=A0A5C6B8X3_9BACT|nr:sulfatase-like hydrolase/transferase [Stieleria varia]TWU07891.1 Arylsulfatase [Stieleria varia]